MPSSAIRVVAMEGEPRLLWGSGGVKLTPPPLSCLFPRLATALANDNQTGFRGQHLPTIVSMLRLGTRNDGLQHHLEGGGGGLLYYSLPSTH
jgi:hypothetical protein